MAEPIFEEPPFGSVNHALAFAFNFTHGTLKRNGLARMMGGPSWPSRGLAGLDGAAQAGMIKSALDKLHDVYRCTLIARFTPVSAPCICGAPCCRGAREPEGRRGAVVWLADHVRAIGLCGTVDAPRFRRLVVSRYFGEKVSFIAIAGECGVHRDTASNLNARVVDYFRGRKEGDHRGVEWRARVEFEARLKAMGVLP